MKLYPHGGSVVRVLGYLEMEFLGLNPAMAVVFRWRCNAKGTHVLSNVGAR